MVTKLPPLRENPKAIHYTKKSFDPIEESLPPIEGYPAGRLIIKKYVEIQDEVWLVSLIVGILIGFVLRGGCL